MPIMTYLHLLLAFLQAAFGVHVASMPFDNTCYDFETASRVVIDPYTSGCAGKNWDVSFGYGNLTQIKTALFPNLDNGTSIAFTSYPFDQVNRSTLATLVFQRAYPNRPLDAVAIIHTSSGNYFKVQLIKESFKETVFRWQLLLR